MREPITMPALSDTMSTGRLVRWLKQVGDPVKSGDTLAEVETDKAIMEIEAFHDGFLAGPLAAIDTDIPVRSAIAYIADTAADASAGHEEPATAAAPAPSETAPMPQTDTKPVADAESPNTISTMPAAPAKASSTVRASPYARSLARDLGVELEKVTPGSDGIVQPAAIVRAFGQPPAPNLDAGPPYRIERLSSTRQAMARNMIACLSTPTFRITALVSTQKLREAAEAKKISFTVLIARACARTVKAIPMFNAVYTPDGLARRDRVDVAIAVDSPDGLITPVLRDVGERVLADLVEDWHVLRDKVTHRRLTPQEYLGATFYVSNLGMFPAVQRFDAILPLGAAAILCIGTEDHGQASFTICCDHRVISGADGARFLQELGKQVEEADALFELSADSA